MPQTWSAYVDVVSADGERALIVRVSHDPAADRAEIWVHAFLDARCFAHMSAHSCPPMTSPATGEGHQRVVIDLHSGQLQATVLASQTDRTVFGEGAIPMTVDMTWVPQARQGSNLRGRDERVLRVDAVVSLEGQTFTVSGWGHQHTQLQEQPRFAVPFTYLSLRGDEAAFIGLLAPVSTRGFGRLRSENLSATSVSLEPIAETRRIRLTTEAPLDIEGHLTSTYRYWIPMGGGWRDGSIVTGTLAGSRVSGVINDYTGPIVAKV